MWRQAAFKCTQTLGRVKRTQPVLLGSLCRSGQGSFPVVTRARPLSTDALMIHPGSPAFITLEGNRLLQSIHQTIQQVQDRLSDWFHVWMSSTLKKRRKKMNKHKLRKRRKKERKKVHKSRHGLGVGGVPGSG